MDFIGSHDNILHIPVPNTNLSPEFLCKNYPFNFLMQPIIPLLSPPVLDEPSLSIGINIPWMKEICGAVSRTFERPTVSLMGGAVVMTCLVYGAWKVSAKWKEAIFNMTIDPDTEKLDEEVAMIMSQAIPPEESTISVCSSELIRVVTNSNSSLFTDRLSQEIFGPGTDYSAPLKHIQNRIDEVMSRVEDVMNGLKALESGTRIFEGKEKTTPNQDVPAIDLGQTFQVISSPAKSCKESPTIQKADFQEINRRAKEIEGQVEDITTTSNFQRETHQALGRDCSPQSSVSSQAWDKSISGATVPGEGNSGRDDTSPPKLPASLSPLRFEHAQPPVAHIRSPQRNMKRSNSLKSRTYGIKVFPPIEENPFSPLMDKTGFDLGDVKGVGGARPTIQGDFQRAASKEPGITLEGCPIPKEPVASEERCPVIKQSVLSQEGYPMIKEPVLSQEGYPGTEALTISPTQDLSLTSRSAIPGRDTTRLKRSENSRFQKFDSCNAKRLTESLDQTAGAGEILLDNTPKPRPTSPSLPQSHEFKAAKSPLVQTDNYRCRNELVSTEVKSTCSVSASPNLLRGLNNSLDTSTAEQMHNVSCNSQLSSIRRGSDSPGKIEETDSCKLDAVSTPTLDRKTETVLRPSINHASSVEASVDLRSKPVAPFANGSGRKSISSPFKRGSRGNPMDLFQVKYNKAKESGPSPSSSAGDKEDEWIVIVPTFN